MTYEDQDAVRELDIAIVGMSGRFPGAANIAEFWQKLRDGVESTSFLSEDELQGMGVPLATIRHPQFVKAAPLLCDIDQFDANFFGYSPREATLIDPQHRLFLECAWEALESAGYQSDGYRGLIGVYAGTSLSSYLLYNLVPRFTDVHADENLEMMIGNDKDFLSTRVAYKLNLTGPAVTVQTGCSTSLVAIHLACQALLNYQCDTALAGGVSVHVPQCSGYYSHANGVASPDGHCRTFDAHAQGTLFGSGVGVVVLKRLADALKDGDIIHAVIKGSAINNDGSQKVGYTAPSVEGQSSVILAAQAIAGVEPESISYVECHGTATALGDPVEVESLTQAFRTQTGRKGFCGLGSVKSNIGHLDAASGVAGLIKTTLSLKHRTLPATLHFESPNPKIDFANSPFYVNHDRREWKNGPAPLRAGVSSFGIGGTNAHVILEEAPVAEPSGPSRDFQLLTLSAKTQTALDAATANLTGHFRQHPESKLADAAYTLATGRKCFPFRRMLVCSDVDDAVAALEKQDPSRVFNLHRDLTTSPIAFMFPGGGAQYANMGLDLYRSELAFREEVDLCCELLRERLGFDLKEYLFPSHEQLKEASARLKGPLVGLPALFTIQYALAKLWMSWGIRPEALIGYSLGEYTAACLAGVFSLEDALSLVVTRSRLFEQLPPGAMAAVPLSSKEVHPLLGSNLAIAAINGEAQCIVSGPKDEIDIFVAKLSEQDVDCRRVPVVGAGHCPMVEPVLGPFREFLKALQLSAPQIPYVSNLTGTWITAAEATDPEYWVRHLRETVLFGAGIRELLRNPVQVLLEVGPGHTLSSIAKSQTSAGSSQIVLPSMRHAYDQQSDVKFLLTAVGKLWLAGTSINWQSFYKDERRLRALLPSYPFERQSYWIQPRASDMARPRSSEKIWNVDEWFHVPSWRAAPLPITSLTKKNQDESWLVFAGENGLTSSVIDGLRNRASRLVVVRQEEVFRKISHSEFALNASVPDDYIKLLEELETEGIKPQNILHLWSITGGKKASRARAFKVQQQDGMYSLIFLAQALAKQSRDYRVNISVISDELHMIESSDTVLPDKVMILSPCMIIPQEYENISCRCIEINFKTVDAGPAADLIFREVESLGAEVVAYRGAQRWVRSFEPIRLEEAKGGSALFEDGAYVITGGTGNLGLQLAERLAAIKGTKIALLARSVFPAKEEWHAWLQEHEDDDPVCSKIRRLMAMEANGAEVMVLAADVADINQMQQAIETIRTRWGKITGVLHLAGITGAAAMNLISDMVPEECERQFRPKIQGLQVLETALQSEEPHFCIFFSSTAAVLGGLGSVAYSAANLFLDAFAQSRRPARGTRWISVNWDGWLLDGEERFNPSLQTSLERYTMTPAESWQCLCRIVASAAPGQIVVSTGDLVQRMKLWINREAEADSQTETNSAEGQQSHTRPVLGTAYVPPSNELEATVLAIWQRMLGIDRVGIHDNFFELGGNSLIGIKMIGELKKALNIEIPAIALFQGPTVTALCEVIQQKKQFTPAFEESRARGLRRRESNAEDQEIVAT